MAARDSHTTKQMEINQKRVQMARKASSEEKTNESVLHRSAWAEEEGGWQEPASQGLLMTVFSTGSLDRNVSCIWSFSWEGF